MYLLLPFTCVVFVSLELMSSRGKVEVHGSSESHKYPKKLFIHLDSSLKVNTSFIFYLPRDRPNQILRSHSAESSECSITLFCHSSFLIQPSVATSDDRNNSFGLPPR
jgi:hypothetical protein